MQPLLIFPHISQNVIQNNISTCLHRRLSAVLPVWEQAGAQITENINTLDFAN